MCVHEEWAKTDDDFDQNDVFVIFLYNFPESRFRLAVLIVRSDEQISTTVYHEDDVKYEEAVYLVPRYDLVETNEHGQHEHVYYEDQHS